MRATTPLDELQHLGDFVELPKPRYAIGTRVNLEAQSKENLEHYFKTALREIIRDTRTIITRLQLQGYMRGMVGKKFLPYNKEQIRAKLDMMRFADSVELAGMSPQGMHVTGTVGNQCYLQNGQCHSGVEYRYYLLFRRTVNGNKQVYIHPHPIIAECYL